MTGLGRRDRNFYVNNLSKCEITVQIQRISDVYRNDEYFLLCWNLIFWPSKIAAIMRDRPLINFLDFRQKILMIRMLNFTIKFESQTKKSL